MFALIDFIILFNVRKFSILDESVKDEDEKISEKSSPETRLRNLENYCFSESFDNNILVQVTIHYFVLFHGVFAWLEYCNYSSLWSFLNALEINSLVDSKVKSWVRVLFKSWFQGLTSFLLSKCLFYYKDNPKYTRFFNISINLLYTFENSLLETFKAKIWYRLNLKIFLKL